MPSPNIVMQAMQSRPRSQEAIYAMLVAGAARMGKFWGVLPLIERWMQRRSGAMLCCFPIPKENGPITGKLAHQSGCGNRTDFDSLDDPNHCLGCIAFPKAADSDPYVREMHNRDIEDSLLELLGRDRAIPIEHQPTVTELAQHAIRLCLKAEIHVTLEHLLSVGKWGHPLFHQLLDACVEEELVWYWRMIPKQGAAVRKDLASYWRLTEQKLGDPRILPRQTDSRFLMEAVEKGWNVIAEGSKSRRASRAYLGLVSMSFKQAIYELFSLTGKPHPALEINDEVQSHGWTAYDAQALREMPKMGWRVIAISHGPRLMADPEENAATLQNFQMVRAHGCRDWHVALELAHRCGGLLDPYLIHSTETRTSQRHAGFSVEKTQTVTKTKGKNGDRETSNESVAQGERLLPQYETEEQTTTRYFPLDDQFKLIASGIMGLGFREALDVTAEGAEWRTLPLLNEPWVIPEVAEVKWQSFLKEMYRRPHYRRPQLAPPVGMLSLPSSESTRQPSTKSSNGHSGHSNGKSLSAPTKALLGVLRRTGRNRDVR